MEIIIEELKFPSDANIILGQSHFIKSVEDLYEIMVNSVPGIKFGLAFCEASGPCLIRKEGTDNELMECAIENMHRLGAGHSFLIVMQNAFPINVLNAIKNCPEVVNIFCATANPVQVILAKTEQGNGILGVIDGNSPKGIELDTDITHRKRFLRNLGYKR
ncbi:adenosine-specific kinase [Candidatus Syntrophosphaera thermopropionivorans]|jgi:adenosine/AMP kinase|uniref:Adenosine monophosphate-protein transferase n=1 Tax=Candidatus Syntrophosphaera thermopropionivorans TaxID=2593015 RepID=A0AC61QKV6_9BACT|nr:adenosine-specific kinase [Candidatus Syntrophosphaera thermopropionivorans]TDF74609.1 adenosine monophosphate-protein transferase [Candidatus Syntrophosphaera thermopropionivorans]HOJ41190.1 adenosine-specific kinase [Candidatus Syntrophosphaera thermopropionivorans]HOL33018.1 adenosine-specific kinase [Candidatus Syntrophosphaera thermopropionivorans]HPQ30473.1 adenosine-specific kinase [Candidatus Syntrophosphaera thermopropionivorans]HQH47005.1 adenosine-specific kinase [Candidatus Synt